MGKADGKPVRLTGKALALLGDTEWGRLKTEVPVNRHVTLEHACKSAHHTLPSASAADRQTSPSKGRRSPDTAANRSRSPDLANSGKLVEQNSSSLQQLQTLSTVGQAPGSAASSPRSPSPNSYLARSGKLNPSAAQPRSSSPLSRPGNVETPRSLIPVHRRSSSPLPHPAADGHVTAQSASHGSHGKHAGSRGRPALTWHMALEEVWKVDKAKPSFMQSLRTRSLSPQSHASQCKSKAVTQPVWQKYQRHATPDRVSARRAPIRRVFHGLSRTASGPHSQQGRAFCKEFPEAGPSGLDHVPNQAPTVMSPPAKKKMSRRIPANVATDPAAVLPGIPWSPAGKALAPKASLAGKPSKSPGLFPSAKASNEPQQEGTSGMGAGALLSQPRPIRAGQQALAALLAKQAAWELTIRTSLPPVMSQITALLQCNPGPIQTPPARSAQELVIVAHPQLGQQLVQTATTVGRSPDQWQKSPAVVASDTVAVGAQSHDPDAISALEGDLNLPPAKIAQPALMPSSSLSTCSFKAEYRVSFAEQIQAALESEAQHAKHGAAQSSRKYFQGEGYFQETSTAKKKEAQEGGLKEGKAEEGASHGLEEEEAAEGPLDSWEEEKTEGRAVHELEEEEVLNEIEEEQRPDALDTLCDAGEPWRELQTV